MADLKSTYQVSDDPILRFCAFYIFLYLGSLILGGIGIFLIVFGLTFLFSWVFARTHFGQAYIRRIFGFKKPEQIATQTHSRIYKIMTTLFMLIVLGFYTYAGIFLIWMGIKLLLDYGFLNQNLIYILFFKSI